MNSFWLGVLAGWLFTTATTFFILAVFTVGKRK